jgi:hypothetical protein
MRAVVAGMELFNGEIVDSHQLESLLNEIGGAVRREIGVVAREFLLGEQCGVARAQENPLMRP